MTAPALMTGTVQRFSYATIGRVVFGRGRAPRRLAELLTDEVRRVLLVAGANVDPEAKAKVIRALGERSVDRFDVEPRLDVEAALLAAESARACRAQAIVVLGDEVAVEVAKGAILALDGLPLPLFCMPTELAGAEFSRAVEVIDREGRRHMRREAALHAKAVLLDADLATRTESKAWAASGLRLLDHAIERILSTDHLLLVDTRLVAGVRLIDAFLVPSLRSGPGLVECRERLLGALWLIQSNAGNVRG